MAQKKRRMDTDVFAYALLGIIVLVMLFFVFKDTFTDEPKRPVALVGGDIKDSVATAILKDGVQEITLSWGTLTYEPNVIHAKADVPLRIKADLDRLSGCYRSFVVPELGVQKIFDEKNDTVEFLAGKKGTYHFTCTMGMGKGTLIFD